MSFLKSLLSSLIFGSASFVAMWHLGSSRADQDLQSGVPWLFWSILLVGFVWATRRFRIPCTRASCGKSHRVWSGKHVRREATPGRIRTPSPMTLSAAPVRLFRLERVAPLAQHISHVINLVVGPAQLLSCRCPSVLPDRRLMSHPSRRFHTTLIGRPRSASVGGVGTYTVGPLSSAMRRFNLTAIPRA